MAFSAFGKHVVAAVDLSDDWTNVVHHAARYAEFGRSTLHVLHILEDLDSGFAASLSRRDRQAHEAHLREEAVNRIGAYVDKVASKAGLKSQLHILTGKPWKTILNTATDLKAGLIVAGAGVTEGSEWLFVGTTSDRLIRNSKVPVLMVGSEAPKRLKRILVPTDMDRPDQGAVRLAANLALQEKGRVSVLHAYTQPSILHRYSGNVAQLRKEAKKKAKSDFDKFIGKIKLPEDASTPRKLLHVSADTMDVHEVIMSEAMRLKMDVIVMALGGISFFESFMIGSVAEKIIRHLPCSLLSLPTSWAKRR